MNSMKVLFLGAGPVTLVYARHLLLGGALTGGARIGMVVRERYRERLLQPLLMGKHGWRSIAASEWRISPEEIFTSVPDAKQAESEWDWVVLCVPSSAIRSTEVQELLASFPRARFVTFQLGPEDRQWLEERIPAERLYTGVLPLAAYWAPLGVSFRDHPQDVKGMNYWFIPGVPFTLFGESSLEAQAFCGKFRAGGLPLHLKRQESSEWPMPDVLEYLLTSLVAGMELCGWSLDKLLSDPGLQKKVLHGYATGFRAIYLAASKSPPFWLGKFPRPVFALLARLARALMPIPLEPLFRVHFTKVRAQMGLGRVGMIHSGERLGLPVQALQELHSSLKSL